MALRRPVQLLLLALCASGLAACGGDEDEAHPTRGRFRLSADQTAERLLTLLAQGEFEQSRDLFLPEAWVTFESNLDLMRKNFMHPTEGPRVKEEMEARIGGVSPEEWRDLESAGPAALWDFWIRTYPLPVPPKFKGRQLNPNQPSRVILLFQGPLEVTRQVELVRVEELWSVRDIQLP